MELFEIDPELFISCRLCLDEKGIYQIIPSVKDQIKYCFDIDVEQFDGLPQLLCKKCKGVLSEFYETKKRYKEKQDKLIETKAPKRHLFCCLQTEAGCLQVAEQVAEKLVNQVFCRL
ncbi:hypothetical protein EVAR_11933_1 [Eumeta japonica]|uniref:ZAD domain-containing protein n=1 Tax=Eumeta variegata TaxID=151549 RepID=A0A4C1U4L5_EUMVA|nr:hypothetical protein EVAR_11933_1 [Eumeta japonica]